MDATRDLNPCELVHEDGDPQEIAQMLASRFNKGWDLDRIIKHHLSSNSQNRSQRLVIYLFKLNPTKFYSR